MDYLKDNYDIDLKGYEHCKNDINYLQTLNTKMIHALTMEHQKVLNFRKERESKEEGSIGSFELCFENLYHRKPDSYEVEEFKDIFYNRTCTNITNYLLKLQNCQMRNTLGILTYPDVPQEESEKIQSRSQVQSIIFEKKYFKTKEQCIDWLRRQNKEKDEEKYDFTTKDYDESDEYHRFRQFNPKEGARFRTVEIDKGVKFIFMYLS